MQRGVFLLDFSDLCEQIRMKSLLSQSDFLHEIGVSFSTADRCGNGKTITKIFELNFSVNHNIHFAVDIYISKDDKNRNGVTNDAYH